MKCIGNCVKCSNYACPSNLNHKKKLRIGGENERKRNNKNIFSES